MQTLFLNLQNQLKTIASLKYIDEDWGQLEAFSENPPANFPMALIDLGQIQWSNEGKEMQRGDGSITISVASIKMTRSNANAPSLSREKAFDIFNIIQQVHDKLHCWVPAPGCSKLIRQTTSKVKRDDGIKQYNITYSIIIEDEAKVVATAPATVKIQTQVV